MDKKKCRTGFFIAKKQKGNYFVMHRLRWYSDPALNSAAIFSVENYCTNENDSTAALIVTAQRNEGAQHMEIRSKYAHFKPDDELCKKISMMIVDYLLEYAR